MGTNRYLKTTIIAWALLVALLGFYVSLFLLHEWLGSGARLVAVFCILPYAIIYFHREWKYGIGILVVVSAGLGFYVGRNLYLVLGFIAVLIGFYKTADTIHEDIHNKIKVSDFDVFTGESVGNFVTYMTLAYVFTFISFNPVFNLDCEELYQYSNRALDIALLRDSTMQQYIEGFFTTSIRPLIDQQTPQIKASITDGNSTNKPIPSSNTTKTIQDPGAKYRVSPQNTQTTQEEKQGNSIVDAVQVHQAADSSSNGGPTLSVKKFEEIRDKLLQQTLDQSNNIEEGVCAIVFKEIKAKYTNPNFKISVIFMMYLVMRPAMEMVLHLISYLNRALFRMMFKLGWFKKYEDWEVSENLE